MVKEMKPIWEKSRDTREKSSGKQDFSNDLSFYNLTEDDMNILNKERLRYIKDTYEFLETNKDAAVWFYSIITTNLLQTFQHFFEIKLERSHVSKQFDRDLLLRPIFFSKNEDSIAHVAIGGTILSFSVSTILELYRVSKYDPNIARKSLIEIFSHELYHCFAASVFDRSQEGTLHTINGFHMGDGVGEFFNEGLIELMSKRLVRENADAFGLSFLNNNPRDKEYRHLGGYTNSESLIVFLLNQICNYKIKSEAMDNLIQALELSFFSPLSEENNLYKILELLLLGTRIPSNRIPEIISDIFSAKSDEDMGLVEKKLINILYPNLNQFQKIEN